MVASKAFLRAVGGRRMRVMLFLELKGGDLTQKLPQAVANGGGGSCTLGGTSRKLQNARRRGTMEEKALRSSMVVEVARRKTMEGRRLDIHGGGGRDFGVKLLKG